MRYTMPYCGEKWGEVGHIRVRSLIFTTEMGQKEHLF